MPQKGIDIAYCNEVTNWNTVKKAVDFVIMRDGYGGEVDQEDALFERHYQGAKSVGLPIGVYHYSYAKTTARAKVEAEVSLQWLKGKTIEGPVFYDIEDASQASLGKDALTDIVLSFCETIEKAGFRAGVYASKYWLTEKLDYDRLKNYPIWVAQYNSVCTFANHYDLWQYTSTGKVDGINGNIDLDYCYDENLFSKADQQGEKEQATDQNNATGVQTYSKKKDGSTHLTSNFKVSEFACHDGSDSILIDVDGVQKLQKVRDLFQVPIIINSAYRTKTYNEKIGGASNSYHMKGMAFDTAMSGISLSLMAKAYEVAGMGGTIIYDDSDFVHTDTRTSTYYAYSTGSSMTTNLQTLKNGSKGRHVKDLQFALNRFYKQELTVDGIFGTKTQQVVEGFQLCKQLTVDGICGKKTWSALLQA